MMKVTVLYVGSSLLGPLKNAEREINREHGLDVCLSAYNFGAPFTEEEWGNIENDLAGAAVVFVIHVMDGENAARLIALLDRSRDKPAAVVVINCMPELMKRTRLGKLDASTFGRSKKDGETRGRGDEKATSLLSAVGSWIGKQARARKSNNGHGHASYLKWVDRLPGLLRVIPGAGRLRDVKNYLLLVCYFLQPTPANIRSMVLYALKNYVDDDRLKGIEIPPPEAMPSVAIYHPDAPALFESFEAYRKWYVRNPKSNVQSPKSAMQRRLATGR